MIGILAYLAIAIPIALLLCWAFYIPPFRWEKREEWTRLDRMMHRLGRF